MRLVLQADQGPHLHIDLPSRRENAHWEHLPHLSDLGSCCSLVYSKQVIAIVFIAPDSFAWLDKLA
jgi:hypothetical protein